MDNTLTISEAIEVAIVLRDKIRTTTGGIYPVVDERERAALALLINTVKTTEKYRYEREAMGFHS
jgi:hypothetical protein